MAINNNDVYSSTLSKLKNRLKSVKEEGEARRIEFGFMLVEWSDWETGESHDRALIDLMNCTSFFSSVEDKIYFFQFSLEQYCLKSIKLIEASNFHIHQFRSIDGRSDVHYMADLLDKTCDGLSFLKSKTLELMEYFLKNPRENYSDDRGFTYFHAACVSGNAAAVNLLLSRGVDVNLDTYKYSALHFAAQYRYEEIVEILLRHGADPNQPDHEQSTPLHALTRLCICRCTNIIRFCDKRKQVDKIVQMLIKYGANIEARNRDGDSPLDLAVSRFDVQLVKSLLEHGASLDNLNEDKIFSAEFTSTELKNYPLTLNIIQMIQLLQSADFKMSFETRFKMLKFWIKVRGNDTDHLIVDCLDNDFGRILQMVLNISTNLFIYREFGFHMTQEAKDFLHQKCASISRITSDDWQCYPDFIDLKREIVAKIKKIMLTDDISLHHLCQMNYSKGYSIIKKLNNWQLPPMDDVSCTEINLIVKRHVANILIRPHLELFAADLFMTDYCKLSLPYVACRRIAEYMSHEELLRLCDQTDENKLKSSPTRHKRKCDDDDTESQPGSSRQRVS